MIEQSGNERVGGSPFYCIGFKTPIPEHTLHPAYMGFELQTLCRVDVQRFAGNTKILERTSRQMFKVFVSTQPQYDKNQTSRAEFLLSASIDFRIAYLDKEFA